MTNPLRTEYAKDFALLLLRLTLGTTFLLVGIMKVRDMGVTNFVNENSSKLPAFLPKPIGQTYLYAVPFVELIVAALLILGLLTRTAASIATLMIISFTIAVTGVFMYKPYFALQANPVFITVAFLLATTGAGKFSVDRLALKSK
jgi:uncharacterized membrane protein YphA (DoxX/SURF4 family)